MTSLVTLRPGWWCWLEVPVARPGWGVGPIYVTDIEPMKTGKALLCLHFIQLLHPIAAQERIVVFRVTTRTTEYLMGTIKLEDGLIQTVIITAPDYAWLQTYSYELINRRKQSSYFALPTAEDWLASVFGHSPRDILKGAVAGSFGHKHSPMPGSHATFNLDLTANPFGSWLIARGIVPTEMEQKWFIYMDDDHLFFRRSWTGFLIFDVETAWRGDQLYLSNTRVNRDERQYTETNLAYDQRLVTWLIRAILLAEPADFLTQPGDH
ncbi:hypothetical protein [Kozakia baliensis]|uniref:hypothetical protein n=1 Tax=Kozakia baliensis TaxID=153496 RepID=UPI0011673294|nr:hypothetical protein [Kozakia baliensis]GBR34392.1 hypothetical protein AA0488_2862 [Kozakia baliensis NRIC 0488]GEL65455.1 hypothetical protein KBA01_27410 [Kozakia baliensis]